MLATPWGVCLGQEDDEARCQIHKPAAECSRMQQTASPGLDPEWPKATRERTNWHSKRYIMLFTVHHSDHSLTCTYKIVQAKMLPLGQRVSCQVAAVSRCACVAHSIALLLGWSQSYRCKSG